MQTNQPPLRTLTVKELYEILWLREESIKQNLINVLEAIGVDSEAD